MRRDCGYSEELPDLAVWINSSQAPGAVIAEHGGRREDRQKMILEGWRDAVSSGRYLAVRYDCASPSVARWIARLARKIGLADTEYQAFVQTTAEQIAALRPAAPDNAPATNHAEPSGESERTADEQPQTAPAQAPAPRAPAQIRSPIPARTT